MPCFYCGKRVSIVRQLTDADFCSDEHRTKYHELTRTALSRLVESHEQVAASPRRKGKGQTAVKEPPPSLSARLEVLERETDEQPVPHKQAPLGHEEAAPAPERRPARPHRQPPPVIVTPPPTADPDPPLAGFAQSPVATFSVESALHIAGDKAWTLKIEIGEGVRPVPFGQPADSPAPAEAPEPASWLPIRQQPRRLAVSPRIEPAPKRAPRPAIPLATALSGGGLQPAKLIPPPTPRATQSALEMARQALPAAFRVTPVVPALGRHVEGSRTETFQDPPVASHAAPAPPAPARGDLDAKGVRTSGRMSIRPAMPGFGLGLPGTGAPAPAALLAIDMPRPCGKKPALRTAVIPPAGPAMALMQASFAHHIAEPEQVASNRSLPPVSGIQELAMPAARRGQVVLLSLPDEAPLAASPSVVAVAGVPAVLPPPVAITAPVRLTWGAAAAMRTLSVVAISGTPADAGWAAFALDQARIPEPPDHAVALQGLPSGRVQTTGMPAPKLPARRAPSHAEASFAPPDTLHPPVPARFDLRIPETMPPIANPPKVFAGEKPGPLGIPAALSAQAPGLPVFETRFAAALHLEQRGPQVPGTGKAFDAAAEPRGEAVPIEFDQITRPAPLSAPARTLALAGGGVLATEASVKRNVRSRPAGQQAAEFAAALAEWKAETEPLAALCQLPAGGATRQSANRPNPGALSPLPPNSSIVPPQATELPGPQPLAGRVILAGAGYWKVQNGPLAGTVVRQTAGWQPHDCGSGGFASLGSNITAAQWSPISGGRFLRERARAVSGGSRPVQPVAAEIPLPAVLKPESTRFSISLRPAPVFRLDVHPRPDDRTAVKTVRLAPLFRSVRRPTRLPVFGRARHGKAVMPEAVFLPPGEHEDFEDSRTMRIAPGFGACPVRMLMPASKPRSVFTGTLGTAGLLRHEAGAAAGTVRAAAFDYKIPLFRPHLPDGWVDTVPVEFDAAAAEAAREQNWEPLVGAIKNATRFFKFMCLGVMGLLVLRL